MLQLSPRLTPWELSAENIAVKIRWLGLLIGVLYVNVSSDFPDRPVVNGILALGASFTILATHYFRSGRVFLGRYPLIISMMEAFFIGLLCHFGGGLDSPFRYYYLLSLICCALRYSARITYFTCMLDCLSYTILYAAQPSGERSAFVLFLMLVVLCWVTWAATAMSDLLKRTGEQLSELNASLRENQAMLEARIEERTRELQDAQALVLHQEKMAAFGLLAAGIAHEVGNPLTSISAIVQILEKRDLDSYTRERLVMVGGQLQRIQGILREVINFGRPASRERTRVALSAIVNEALSIAKYYKDTKSRTIVATVPTALPLLFGIRDQLVQVVFNLVLNAIDATAKGGKIEILAEDDGGNVIVTVRDNGAGIAKEHVARLFQPYFTTKRSGTGLGLFVTQKLVAEFGGRVEFESEPGVGTAFRVVLPVETKGQRE